MTSYSRNPLLVADQLDWAKLWNVELDSDQAVLIVRQTERELNAHEAGSVSPGDYDLAFGVDLVRRLVAGLTSDGDARVAAHALLERTSALYPAASTYEPNPEGPPAPTSIIEEIQERFPVEEEQHAEPAEDEIPF